MVKRSAVSIVAALVLAVGLWAIATARSRAGSRA